MARKKWGVWLSGRGPDREGIIETLKAGGYDFRSGILCGGMPVLYANYDIRP